MHMDDTALPFVSREQICKGINIAQRILTALGLEMHTGKHWTEINEETGESKEISKDSKTECVFFPAQGYFKQSAIANFSAQDEIPLVGTDHDRETAEQRRARILKED